MTSLTARARSIPPEMMLDIAAGMEEPKDIAFRYGFAASEFDLLEENSQFLQQVAAIRSKRESTGEAAVARAGMMHDILAGLYFQRLNEQDVSVSALAAGVEAFAVYGSRKPKPANATADGPKFSITFNVPNAPTIQMQTVEITTEDKLKDMPTFDFIDVEPNVQEEPDGELEV